MPGPPDFEGMKGVGVGDAIEIGLSLGREAGVEAGFFAANREDPDTGGQVKIQCFH